MYQKQYEWGTKEKKKKVVKQRLLCRTHLQTPDQFKLTAGAYYCAEDSMWRIKRTIKQLRTVVQCCLCWMYHINARGVIQVAYRILSKCRSNSAKRFGASNGSSQRFVSGYFTSWYFLTGFIDLVCKWCRIFVIDMSPTHFKCSELSN